LNVERFFWLTAARAHNIISDCYMHPDSTTRFIGALLDLIDDFVSEVRSRMIATQLIRTVAATAAKYRAVQRTRRRIRAASKMCLILEEADRSAAWSDRLERNRLSRRLEPVRQALFVADEIIEKTFAQRRTGQPLARYAVCQTPPKMSLQNKRRSTGLF
jgi:hypothetical protein